MRTHAAFPDLQPWSALPNVVRELADVAHLVAARIEPVTRGREPAAFLDLTFEADGRSLTIPLIYIDLAQLDVREVDPLVFPAAYASLIDDDRARALVDRMFPDLETRAHRDGFRAEEAILYGDAVLFVRAREAGLYGAAPLTRTIPLVAPAVFARRFARNARVLAYGPGAAGCAAFVRDIAGSVTATAGADPTGRAWYGVTESAAGAGGYDLAVGDGPPPARATTIVRFDAAAPGLQVPVVMPLPGDLLLSFDAADGPVHSRFAVTTEREPFRRMPAVIDMPVVGGSAGRITLVVRPDALAIPDSDTDEAAAFSAMLRREGFTPVTVASIDALAETTPDLVHLFGVAAGAFALHVATWAAEHHVPLAVHAHRESPDRGGYWGSLVAPYCFGYSADDRSVRSYLDMLARRGVEVDGVTAAMTFAPPETGWADGDRVLRSADIVFVHSAREREAMERVRPSGLTLVVPPLPIVLEPDEVVGALVGHESFVLVHAPIGPAQNQLVLARACADVGVPVVFSGNVEDPGYAERLREFAAGARLISEPSPGVVNALYRAAAVVADAVWIPRGHGRLMTAAAAGAAIVVSTARWFDLPLPERWRVDPANVVNVARGIGEALDAAARNDAVVGVASSAAREQLAAAAAAVVAGYAKIASTV